MAEGNESDSELADDPFLNGWELSCLDDWDKTFVSEERRVQTESEKSSHRLWSAFQNSASSVSQLYKDGLQSHGVSLWIPFQLAAGNVTSLYKDSQELIRKSFELGNQMGCHRRNKELLSWLRKRKRTLQREEFVAFICEKPMPTTRLRSFARGGACRRAVDLSSPRYRMSSPARDYSPEELQPFKDALSLQGLNGGLANASISRRSMPNNSLLVGLGSTSERRAVLVTDERPSFFSSRKRAKSGGDTSTPGSPSHKKTKVCGMETEDL